MVDSILGILGYYIVLFPCVLYIQNKEYYYQDAGIRDDVIRKAEQEAIKLAKIHNFD